MARIEPAVGEVWFAELGMVEKSRPVLVLAPDEPRNARALVIVAPPKAWGVGGRMDGTVW